MRKENQAGKPEIIDVHSHLYPACYLDYLESRASTPRVIRRGEERLFAIFPSEIGGGGGRPMTPAYWDLDEKLAYMDRAGIDRSVLSLGNPWFNPMPEPAADALARRVNEELAACAAKTGGRTVGMGALPASSIPAVISELGFIAGTAGLVGVSAGPSIAGRVLDDRALDAFWAELVRLDLPLFIHPENGVGGEEMLGYGLALPLGLAFPFETTAAAARLVFGGVLERFPGLRILLAHGGGTLPFLAGRLDALWRCTPALRASLPQTPSDYIKRFYFDTLVYAEPALRALNGLAGPGRLMFGSDHPFEVADPASNLNAAASVFKNGIELNRVLAGSARNFFRM